VAFRDAQSSNTSEDRRQGCRRFCSMAAVQCKARSKQLAVGVRRHPFVEGFLEGCRLLKSLHRLWLRRARPWCLKKVDSVKFQIVMFVITLYALLGDDIRLSATSKPADLAFNIFAIMAFILFSAEMILSCIGKDDYLFSFFFWLDFVATLSLILDITWVYALLIGESFGKEGDTSVARAGRMSKVGTRAGRVIRLLRLIRLLRIIKLTKHVGDSIWRMRGEKGGVAARPGEGTEEEEEHAESRVGQKLSHMTTQKVILLILFMLITLPWLGVEEFFRDLPASSQYGADAVHRSYLQCQESLQSVGSAVAPNATLSCQSFEQQLIMFIGFHHRAHITNCHDGWNQAFSDCSLDLAWIGFRGGDNFTGIGRKTVREHWEHVFADGAFVTQGALNPELEASLTTGVMHPCANIGDEYLYMPLIPEPDLICPDQLRFAEQTMIWPRLVSSEEDPKMVFVFDLRPWKLRFAVFNIMQTFWICILLGGGAMVFSHDANVLVLQPIERMIHKVEKIRDNPLYAMKLGDDSYREMHEEDAPQIGPSESRLVSVTRCGCARRVDTTKVQTLETKILENAIIKLGKLLALGFGEAGSEIIGKNMNDDSATVNAMIPGSKVEAVFGFCSLRDFADTTEVLQDKVMVFVNQVAEIVHNIVDTWHGAANRNIGDAFLIVWRIEQDFEPWGREKTGDMSVMSFVQVVAAINKSAVLKDYREHPALIARLPNYRVRLGFGLHYGWAIEGAIGSEFKIDASYLSPHVNMASRLEAVTSQYQVSILMSDPIARLCSGDMARYFRVIDNVTLKGGMTKAMRLHTIDVNGEKLRTEPATRKKYQNQFEARRSREKAKEEKFRPSFKVHSLFETNDDFEQMRQDYPLKFFQLFNKGYMNYEAGEWDVAREIFQRTCAMVNPDGPSQALLGYMKQYDYDSSKVSPKGWPGFRELTETQ